MAKHSHKVCVRTLFVLIGLLPLLGCTPEKAKSVRLAAEQFSYQALAAINAVEKAMTDELAPRSRGPREQTDQFVDFLAKLDLARFEDENIELDFSILEQAAEPDAFELDPEIEMSRNNYLNALRTRYAAFAGMFQDLEGGSFFSGDAVERAVELVGRMTADMVGIARHFSAHPPYLIQQRGSLVADTLDILENADPSQTAGNDRLVLIKTRFDEIKAKEQELLQSVLEPALKAAETGRRLQKMAAEYKQLRLSEMQDLLLGSIRAAGELTGQDVISLSTETEKIFAIIESDPVFKSVAEQAMQEISAAAAPYAGELPF